MPKPVIDESIKKANVKDDYTDEKNFLDLMACIEDPLFFMQNFMKIQHALKGSLLFEPYEYQTKIINAFANHRNVIAMTGRQMGKSFFLDTKISINGTKIDRFSPYSSYISYESRRIPRKSPS